MNKIAGWQWGKKGLLAKIISQKKMLKNKFGIKKKQGVFLKGSKTTLFSTTNTKRLPILQ
ncbi:hypothetical protein [Flavobacterium notoginsengisoli]|uniref:hypothetical protein n=1 Tax=Flavobacterium notoginsengisoli TaxID=1478199 RepID=UPI00363C0264